MTYCDGKFIKYRNSIERCYFGFGILIKFVNAQSHETLRSIWVTYQNGERNEEEMEISGTEEEVRRRIELLTRP